MILVIHHTDADGYCSAAIIKNSHKDVEFYPYNYEKDVDIDKLFKDKDLVYMVDCSFSPDMFKEIKEKSYDESLIWIDHHNSAIEDSKKYGYDDIDGIRDNEYSGCQLTWKWFNPDEENKFVEYIGLYDNWKHEDNEEIIGLADIAQLENDINSSFWDILTIKDKEKFDNMFKSLVREGKIYHRYGKEKLMQTVEGNCFDMKYKDYDLCIVNCLRTSSLAFDRIDHDKYDIFVCYYFDGDKYNYSFYSSNRDEDLDVGILAKDFGGGGHKGASGFSSDKTPMELFNKD